MNAKPAPQPNRSRAGFTLLELMVVIGIIAIMLVAVIPAVTSLSKSSGRKGAISNLLGAIEQARTQAIKSGRATYVVFPTFTAGTPATVEKYSYKSYAIFEDDPAAPTVPKQITNWKTLPTGVALRAAGAGAISTLPDPTTLSPAVAITFTPEPGADPFRCFKFNSNGEVESPPSSVFLTVFEGYISGGAEVVIGSKSGTDPLAKETITIAHLTGRAERAP